ncbi:RHS repeat-associated core domain-containing protein [Luteolibacter sp. Populi]|uniref:RHS repeat-associated core domain-containing protein n=1 Tax=Luteolibacter sp. Populi TaxID=3230487 RepID=UPI003467BD56
MVTRGGRTIETHRDCFPDQAAEQIVTEDSATTTSPDRVTVARRGLATSSSAYGTAAAETRAYDASGRLVLLTSATGATTAYEYNPTGQLARTRDFQNHVTSYDYYAANHPAAGMLWKTSNAELETTETVYDSVGRVEETKGTGTYRVKWIYNIWGEVSGMRTFRDGGTGDLTQWDWNEVTGMLDSKTDAAGKITSYDYYPSGLLAKRTAPRAASVNVIADYTYNGYGDLEEIAYDDGTHGVVFSGHDRLGRPLGIADASGIRNMAYNSEGAESVSYDPTSLLPGIVLDYTWDSGTLRPTGYITSGSGPAAAWGYDSEGRLGTVTGSGRVHTHSWLPGTNTPAGVSTALSIALSSPVLVREMRRDRMERLRGIETRSGAGTVLARHGYELDKAGRRTRAVGENGQAWDYGYDTLGQVVSGVKSFPGGGAIPGHEFSYQYDGIGNRTAAVHGGIGSATTGTAVSYDTNELNQYEEVTTQGGRFILGESPDPITVTENDTPPPVNAIPAGGLGFQSHRIAGDNSMAPLWSHDTVTSGINSENGHTFTPKASVAPTYDWSGNLTWDGRWDYVWDAENRLASMTTAEIAYNAGVPRQQIGFVYDSDWRRIAKTVSTWNGGGYAFTSNTLFLYDGWNLIGEYSAPSAVPTSLTIQVVHTWGTDVSGTMQGAGGVGGLLATEVKNPAAVCYPAYDANGNISAWVDGSENVLERREYSPFGQLVSRYRFGSDLVLDRLSFGFSAKYEDAETGMLYYGFRFYDPVSGKWISRDPINESGGENLYRFSGNNGVMRWDYLGLFGSVKDAGLAGAIAAAEKSHAFDLRTNKGNNDKGKDYNWAGDEYDFRLEYAGLVCCKGRDYRHTDPHPGVIYGPSPMQVENRRGVMPPATGANYDVQGNQTYVEPRNNSDPNAKAGASSDPTQDPRLMDPKNRDQNPEEFTVTCEKAFGKGWVQVGHFHSHPWGSGVNPSDPDKNITNQGRRFLGVVWEDGFTTAKEY